MQTFIDGVLLKKIWLRFLLSDGLHVHIEYFLANQKINPIQQLTQKKDDKRLHARCYI